MRRSAGSIATLLLLVAMLLSLHTREAVAALFNVSGATTSGGTTYNISGSIDIDTSTASGTPTNSTVTVSFTGTNTGTRLLDSVESVAVAGGYYLKFVGTADRSTVLLQTPKPTSAISFANFSGGTYTSNLLIIVDPGAVVARVDIDVTLSPVPIPAALPLLASAIAGLGYLRRRQRKAA